jgi:MFS family permease
MIAVVLPSILFEVLQLPVLQIGFIDALYQGLAALISLGLAFFIINPRRLRGVAACGYLLSAVARVCLVIALFAGALFVLLSLLLDRIGKGIRTAPRDALISGHSSRESLNAAFGTHRSMDAMGAVLGPLLASLLIALYPQNYALIAAISIVFAVMGCGVFLTRVKSPVTAPEVEVLTRVSSSARASLKELMALPWYGQTLGLFFLVHCFVVSDGLYFLAVQQRAGLPNEAVTYMLLGVALTYMVSAYGFGRLVRPRYARRVLFCGYLLLGVSYVLFGTITPQEGYDVRIVALVLCVGTFYGATDGTLTAHIARQLPTALCTLGLTVAVATFALGKLLSSSLFGWMWQSFGEVTALAFNGTLLSLLVLGVLFFMKLPVHQPHD